MIRRGYAQFSRQCATFCVGSSWEAGRGKAGSVCRQWGALWGGAEEPLVVSLRHLRRLNNGSIRDAQRPAKSAQLQPQSTPRACRLNVPPKRVKIHCGMLNTGQPAQRLFKNVNGLFDFYGLIFFIYCLSVLSFVNKQFFLSTCFYVGIAEQRVWNTRSV